ncbi:MAG: DUF5810 domain-containing protein [Halodesulfurarchaeum sp.]
MGYVCPVCAEREVDGEHLANHLAFTAILRSEGHQTWLDEHVPGWEELDPEQLAAEVTPHAESVDVEIPDSSTEHPPQGPSIEDRGAERRRELSERDREVLEEARELTRRMLGGASDDGEAKEDVTVETADSELDGANADASGDAPAGGAADPTDRDSETN